MNCLLWLKLCYLRCKNSHPCKWWQIARPNCWTVESSI